MKIKICLPVRRGEKIKSIDEIESFSKKIGATLEINENSYINHARNNLITKSQLIHQSKTLEYDKYIFIDSDINCTSKQIEKLTDSLGDIVSGLYRRRDDIGTFTAGYFDPTIPGSIIKHVGRESLYQGMKKVDYAGAGFLCINKIALENMLYPYFREFLVYDKFRQHAEITSEDVGFCVNAHNCGISIKLNTDIEVGHF